MKPCDNKSNIDKCSAKTNCDDKSKDKCHTKKNCDEKSNIDKCNTEKGCDDKSNTGKCIVRTSCEVNSSTDKCNRDKSCSKKSNNNNCSNQSSKDKAIANKTSNGKICGNQSSSNSKAISGKGNDKAIDDKSSHNQSSHKTPNVKSGVPAAPVAPTSFAKPEKSVKSEKPFVPVAPVKPATKSCCVCIMSTGESSSALIVKPKPKRRTTFAPSSSITSTSIAHPFSVSSSQCICGSECDALYDELSRNLADAEYEYKECICFPQSRTGPLKKPTDPPDNTRLQRFWYRAKDMEEYLRMMEDYIDEVEACLKEYVTTRMRQREAVEEEQRRLRHELEVIKARAMLLGQGGDK
ncbi:hypothetical protein BGZ58_004523 [Dissophora ornata]|nr:hypothetical protein BGZ58_004523 [Dissophora ornata]